MMHPTTTISTLLSARSVSRWFVLALLSLNMEPSHQQQQSVVSCDDDDESLLQLWFDVSTATRFPTTGSVVWRLQYASTRQSIRSESYNSWEELPEEVILCIPKQQQDDCLLLVVEDLQLDQFRIEWDGSPMTAGTAYPISQEGLSSYKSTTEIGESCIPTCSNDEALLNLTVFTGGSVGLDWEIVQEGERGIVREVSSCQKHTTSSTSITDDCGWSPWETYHVHECIPKTANDACYRFLLRDASSKLLSHPSHRQYPWVSLSLEDTTPLEFQAMAPFESVLLSSDDSSCKPLCQNDDEALLELFISRTGLQEQQQGSIDWSLVDLAQQDETVLMMQSVAWDHYDERQTWRREQTCVKRDACLQFFLSMEPDHPQSATGQYMLLLDNFIYADSTYQFSVNQGEGVPDSIITDGVTIGTECRSSICNTNSLMSLELVANNSGFYNAEWTLQPHESYLQDKTTMEGYFGYNRSGFRQNVCIPKYCFDLDVSVSDQKTEALESYSVTIDGTVYEDALLHRFGDDEPAFYQLHSMECPKYKDGLSPGSVAGVIVCSIAAAAVCIVLLQRILSLRKEIEDQQFQARMDDDKTTASESNHDDEPIDGP
ncbi:expressed unknown protein [Seminavis robusta]|uniref:Uncharacterized protein n=1 Tax=Seminavis robusta TaxID=568900 RepID=A0A9N8E8N5_9STRA|nr:expressed unknown protein [Seminavis robusta]|eukprot:Sro806_g205100.1 n/a (602) ;mRNA; r:18678-20483